PSFMFFQFLLRPPPSATLFPTRRSSDLRARLRAQPGEQPTKQRGISEPCLVFLWPQRVRRGPRRTRCGQKKTRHGSEMPRCFVGCSPGCARSLARRSEERRVGKSVALGGGRSRN